MKNFFGIRRYEFYALLILFLFAVCLRLLSIAFSNYSTKNYTPKYSQQYVDSINNYLRSIASTSIQTVRINPFYFNPNIISADSLLLLGFSKSVARNIVSYRNSGGSFRSFKQLQKIYNMDSALLFKLKKFIVLDQKVEVPRVYREHSTTKAQIEHFDLNTATKYDLMQVNGVGEKLSQNILKYKELLGGYYSTKQLSEVYGLSNEVNQRLQDVCFVDDSSSTTKIKVNKASFKELVRHPYINKSLAILIDEYLKKSYFIASEEEMKTKVLNNDSLNLRIVHYLDFSM